MLHKWRCAFVAVRFCRTLILLSMRTHIDVAENDGDGRFRPETPDYRNFRPDVLEVKRQLHVQYVV